MSGPKVFHVVTRQELVARCEAHLRQLDAAIAEWTKACKRKGATDAHDTEAVALTTRRVATDAQGRTLFRTAKAGSARKYRSYGRMRKRGSSGPRPLRRRPCKTGAEAEIRAACLRATGRQAAQDRLPFSTADRA